VIHIRKQIVTDEQNRPVAVQIEYSDWQEVERLLGLVSNGAPQGAAGDINALAGTIELSEDPSKYQRRIRDEWP
jgi:hypothetical protein